MNQEAIQLLIFINTFRKYSTKLGFGCVLIVMLGIVSCFWYKDHSMITELVKIVADYDCPVGIEWQDFVEDTLEEETADLMVKL